jgi:enamine deaminase RidA (YjgF/YER057c/UK114 family)
VKIEARLEEMGLVLPAEQKLPGGPFPFVPIRILGNRAVIAGHGPLNADGTVWDVRGKVGGELTLEQGQEAAKLVGLAILADLKRAIGDLDRVTAWVKALGMVNSAPGFGNQPAVINGFSDLIMALYGPDVGAHARSAVGMAELPFGIPVEIEAEVEFS